MVDDRILIEGCVKHNKTAQKALYEKYAPKMSRVCYRYAIHKESIQDILQEGFIKVFLNIKNFKNKGSFEGWIRKIMVNTALKHYQQHKKEIGRISIEETDIQEEITDHEVDQDTSLIEIVKKAELSQDELLKCIDELKGDYKVVFNLFYFEQLSHKEIGEMLQIQESSSRSRLSRARMMVQQNLKKISLEKLGKEV